MTILKLAHLAHLIDNYGRVAVFNNQEILLESMDMDKERDGIISYHDGIIIMDNSDLLNFKNGVKNWTSFSFQKFKIINGTTLNDYSYPDRKFIMFLYLSEIKTKSFPQAYFNFIKERFECLNPFPNKNLSIKIIDGEDFINYRLIAFYDKEIDLEDDWDFVKHISGLWYDFIKSYEEEIFKEEEIC